MMLIGGPNCPLAFSPICLQSVSDIPPHLKQKSGQSEVY